MGLSWSLVTAGDALDWYTSMDTRRGAYAAISLGGYFWVDIEDAHNATTAMAAQGSTCMRVALDSLNGEATIAHRFVPSTCSETAMAVCRAAADQRSSQLRERGVLPVDAVNVLWVPGPHALSVSRRLGSGPFGGACAFAIGPINSDDVTAGTDGSVGGSANLLHQLSSVSISMTIQPSNSTDSVAVVGALKLGLLGSVDAPEPAAAGVASSDGWHSVELSPGEVVVAVSGCAGGFVERLVLHTSAGRMWTTPFSAASLCSVPFMEVAPPGAYLVGVQWGSGDGGNGRGGF
ncbi:hypothetical protein GPECTOR_52g41 [Gonium pectorale]|uniref:Uncharacterized protein n=1 Tax=Gonium pectorale TaxID=33097 RepID=A0A150G744_GONPE|nr:hypothetical protein GPECTOR_52g41 [Gonium pectorale]|eukprot:KXZ45641.1 hypothetical protein GPECTOR_52g41 [Gonium pectorale]